MGDLQEATAIDTVDATGLFIHPAPSSLTVGNGGSWLRVGAPVVFTLRKRADSASAVVRMIGAGAAGQGRR